MIETSWRREKHFFSLNCFQMIIIYMDRVHACTNTAQKVTVCKSFQARILHSFQVVHKLGNELKCPSVESLMNGGEQACTPLGHFGSFPSLYTTWKLRSFQDWKLLETDSF